MGVEEQSLMQPDMVGPKKEGDSDAVGCSSDTSVWSTPPRLWSESPQHLWDCEDKADSVTGRTPSVKKLRGGDKGVKAQGPHKQKTKHTVNCHIMKLPPIKQALQGSKPRASSAGRNRNKELKSQVRDLQQQLNEARTENKLLKRLQYRHTMALQHFQDSEGSISQILTKHNNETRVLQRLLRETCSCRDILARQLRATENKLLNTKATLQRLQMLSQDRSLLEREELTLRLAEATAQLEEKDRRILDMEKNFELCQASFNRQVVTEQRKSNEAKKISFYLQEEINQLTKEIQDRERDLEKHNIYSHRFLKRSNKKAREHKQVQTEGIVLPPTVTASVLEMQEKQEEQQESPVNMCCYSPVHESTVIENPERKDFTNVTLEENCQEDVEICAESSDCAKEESSEAAQVLEEKQETQHETEIPSILEKCLNVVEHHKLSKIRRNYTFKQATENLHNGRPAYSSGDMSPHQSTRSVMKTEVLSSETHDPQLIGGKSRKRKD
ncbi:lebercilin-like protein [Mugil cephalus]|uniref:lebercilin-like protein n=1 Tax=Mugil cephalus TaxID=48193 RepID=UPI001FB7A6C2|nr:lebercilin-like protein [Mugil cephalus]